MQEAVGMNAGTWSKAIIKAFAVLALTIGQSFILVMMLGIFVIGVLFLLKVLSLVFLGW